MLQVFKFAECFFFIVLHSPVTFTCYFSMKIALVCYTLLGNLLKKLKAILVFAAVLVKSGEIVLSSNDRWNFGFGEFVL